MRQAPRTRAKFLALMALGFLGIIFTSMVAAWAAEPAVPQFAASARPVRIPLKPLAMKSRPAVPDAIVPDLPSEVAQTRLLAESRCLAEAMYYGTRTDGPAAQIAIAEVILNRLAGGAHGNTLCRVVYEGVGQTFCHFTFVCDGSLDRPKAPEPWRAAQVLAAQLLSGQRQPAGGSDGMRGYQPAAL